MRIALDIMGGDKAPVEIVKGLKLAMTDFPDVSKFLLVGDRQVVVAELKRQDISEHDPRLELLQASQVVNMDDASTAPLRAKKDSSIAVAVGAVKNQNADAVISAGHTGAAVAAMVVLNRMLPDIDRPGIASVFPAPHGPFVMIDIGANVDSKPIHLAQYAIMGELYARMVLKIKTPRVGIISNGEEEGKGNELTRESYQLIKKLPLQFVGNIEGRDLFANKADVVVCDGFVGNAVLKSCEGLAKAIASMLKARLKTTPVRMAGAFLSKNAFVELKEMIDHEEYGGAPLLGVNGICIKAHGSSSAKAIRNAVRVAREMIAHHYNRHLSDNLRQVKWEGLTEKG